MTERDPVVARALATLEAPEHGPQFWAKLDARLAAATDQLKRTPGRDGTRTALPRTGETAAVVVDLRGTESTADARARRPLLRKYLPAAAVLALVAALGVQAMRGPDDAGPDLRARTETPATTPAPTSDAPVTTADSSAPNDPARAQATVEQWLDALGRGDTTTAATLIGPRSEAYVETLEPDQSMQEFLQLVASEGFGAWGRSTDRDVSAVAVGPGEAVVVVRGTLELEGHRERRADAFPAVYAESAGAWFVDPWAFSPTSGGRLDPPRPDPDEDGVRTITEREPLQLAAPGTGTIFVSIDGHEARAHPVERAGEVVTVASDAGLTPEGSLVSVAFTSADGSTFTAAALRVRAA